MTNLKNILLTNIGILLAIMISSMLSFYIGAFYMKVQYYESGTLNVPFFGGDFAAGESEQSFKPENLPKVSDDDHVRGDKNAKIAIIEYSDLECPYCKVFHPTVQQAVDEYKGKLMWVYRHFPLTSIHSKAPKEAEASECANELGGNDGFWAYVDKIYAVTPSNNGLDPAQLPVIAQDLGLDKALFETCLNSGKYANKVSDQYKGGVSAGIRGTPGNVFVNIETGETNFLNGTVPYEELKKVIDNML